MFCCCYCCCLTFCRVHDNPHTVELNSTYFDVASKALLEIVAQPKDNMQDCIAELEAVAGSNNMEGCVSSPQSSERHILP